MVVTLATVVGLWLGISAPSVSPVSPAAPPLTSLATGPASVQAPAVP
ncbi:MAG: hypothetical protein JWM34_184 [Ilumatobacteraceae bacterium]|nr:hypothetical protein [Ilumatobacteraceae bacterium]